MDDFVRKKVIGEGTYGKVTLALLKSSTTNDELKEKDYRAIKSLKLNNENEGFPITALREI